MKQNTENLSLLLEQIRNDDVKAYNELYELFFPSLCVFAARFLTDEDDRKDCVQDVFLKIWNDRKTLVVTTSLRSYLLASTRNRCLNIIEHKGVEQTYEQYLMNTYDPFNEHDLYTAKELEACIQKAISELPPTYQSIFTMSRFDGLTYKEIAQAKNISVKTVEAYISKSLALLNKNLKDFFIVLF